MLTWEHSSRDVIWVKKKKNQENSKCFFFNQSFTNYIRGWLVYNVLNIVELEECKNALLNLRLKKKKTLSSSLWI